MDTYDCEPTMSDTQVMEFCRQGFLVLEGIVPPKVDSKTLESLDAFYATQPEDLPDRTASIPTDLLAESWFMNHVILHPQVRGVVRSLLGRDFALPTSLSNHRVRCPMPAVVPGRQDYWHRDGGGGVGWSLDDNLVPELRGSISVASTHEEARRTVYRWFTTPRTLAWSWDRQSWYLDPT